MEDENILRKIFADGEDEDDFVNAHQILMVAIIDADLQEDVRWIAEKAFWGSDQEGEQTEIGLPQGFMQMVHKPKTKHKDSLIILVLHHTKMSCWHSRFQGNGPMLTYLVGVERLLPFILLGNVI